MQNAPVPIGLAADHRHRMHLEIAADAFRVNDPSVAGFGHVEPTLTVSLLVVITMREEGPQLQGHGRAGDQPVADHRAVGLVLHPDAFLDGAARGRPTEDGQHSIQFQAIQVHEALWIDRPVPVLVSRQRNGLAGRGQQPLLQRGEQDHPLDRGIHRGHQQAVVAPGVDASHGSRGEAAQAVGHQPLAGQGGFQIATGFATDAQRHDSSTRPRR